MRDYYIFDLPIYRSSKKEYDADTESKLEERRQRAFDEQGLPRPSDDEGIRRQTLVEGWARNTLGGCWQFNQTVGWLRLYPEGYQVGAELWLVDAKRYSRTMPKKRFQCASGSNVLAMDVPHPSSSNVIYETLLESLESFASRDWMKRRKLDLSVFKRLGPFVNWHELLESKLQRSK